MDVFTTKQLDRLKEHKYRSKGRSVLEPYVELLWDAAVARLPIWLSPHVVTLAGLLSILVPSTLLINEAYHNRHQNVAFLSYFCSIGFLLWMNLDSIDGKLARRNRPNKQSPFGEILDHGGDALTVLVAFLALGCQLGLQDAPHLMLMWVNIAIYSNYITEPWTIYFTGIMQFESVDFVEFMLILSTISLSTGLIGVEAWRTLVVQFLNLEMRHLILGLQIILILNLMFLKQRQLHTFIGSNRFGLMDVYGPGIPVITTTLSSLMTYLYSTNEFLSNNIILIALFIGLPLVKMHLKFIIVHMMKEKFKPLNYCLLFPIALSIGIFIFKSPELEIKWLLFMMILISLDFGTYWFRVYYQLFNAFNERMFVISTTSSATNLHNDINGYRKHESS